MNRIADLRSTIKTLSEADACFREFALLTKSLAVADAKHELRVAGLAAAHVERTAAERQQLEAGRAAIAAFVDNNRALFEKPRTRKNDQGEYGLRTATELCITDQDALLEALMDRGYDTCMEVVRKPVKSAIRDRLNDGETLPGCTVNTGDTVVCKVSKALLDEARQEALE
jgi:hypothetical protein